MRLTRYTDYALRVVIYLAARPDGLSSVADISEAYGISRNHLTKVVHELGKAGYVTTLRGRSGGIRLARGDVGEDAAVLVDDEFARKQGRPLHA